MICCICVRRLLSCSSLSLVHIFAGPQAGGLTAALRDRRSRVHQHVFDAACVVLLRPCPETERLLDRVWRYYARASVWTRATLHLMIYQLRAVDDVTRDSVVPVEGLDNGESCRYVCAFVRVNNLRSTQSVFPTLLSRCLN